MERTNIYNWLLFSQSYLQIAELACRELIEPKHKKIYREGQHEIKFTYHTQELIAPILYNTKHGIEIFIKTINLIIGKKYNKGHNVKELFEELKQKARDIVNLRDHGNGDDKTIQEMIDNFPQNLEKIEKLIYNFYLIKISNRKLKEICFICDKQNDIFRYPDNKELIEIDWEKRWSKLKKEDIEKIKEDIRSLYKLFNETGYLIETLLEECS